MEKKKILFLLSHLQGGGAEDLVLEYLQKLDKNKFELFVAGCSGGGNLEEEYKKYAKTVFVSKYKILGFGLDYFRFKKFVKEINPDILHSHLFSGDVISYLLKRNNKNLKWISTQHGVLFFLKKIILKKILKSADLVLAVSENIKKILENLKLKKVKLLLNGINLEKFKNTADIDLDKNKINLAVIGRLEKIKGYDLLLKALAEISNKNWHLDVFGAGKQGESLLNLAKKLEINENIKWHGWVSDLENYFSNLDVVVVPSLSEGMSLVVMQAMASGRLVLASQVAAENLLEDGKTGLVFNTGDVNDLKIKLENILKNKNNYCTLAKNGQQFALTNFDFNDNISGLEKILDEV